MVETDKASPSNTNTEKSTLHPAFTVTNVHQKIRILDGKKTPYSNWVKLFKNHLKIYKILHHVDGTPPPSKEDPANDAWAELDALILQWIYSTVSDEILNRILDDDTTSLKAWLQIQGIFINNKHARAATLEQQFTNSTLSGSSSFDEYCQKLKDIATQLGDIDQPVSESRLVIQMVRGLPVEYDTIGAIINQRCPTWDEARGMVEAEQQRQAARSNSSRDTVLVHPSSSAGQQQSKNSNPQDHTDTGRSPYPNGYRGNNYDPAKAARGRGRGGRFSGRGAGYTGGPRFGQLQHGPQTQYPSWTPPPSPFPSMPAQIQPSQAHIMQMQQPAFSAPPGFGFNQQPPTGFNALSPNDIGAAMTTLNLNSNDHAQWFMDTGASSHITSDSGKIKVQSYLPVNPISVGNGDLLPIHGSGNGFYNTPNKTYHLNHIVHSPKVIKDLISVRKFTIDNQVSIEFDPFGFSLKDLKDGQLLSRHNSSGDLYPFTPPTALVATSTSAPWHDRLGHPGSTVLHYLSRFNSLKNNASVDSLVCNSCQISNSKRLPFSDSLSQTFHAFDLVHCDLWTSPVLSNSGYKYYMVLIDNFTHFVWVYPLKYKSETFTNFTKFHKFIQTQFHCSIKTFQCDLGGEFDNHDFKNFADQHGLVFRFSCPQTSQQNGKSERMIRRLNDIIRALLVHSSLPSTFWVEALHTATYLHNILPTKKLHFHTPAFALYRRHPTYDHLRVFGCACYPNMSATQTNKLSPRSTQCVFLGYPADFRGYRCYDPNTGRVHLSRHVTFDEHTFPFNTPLSTTTYTFLDEENPRFNNVSFPTTAPAEHQHTQPDQTQSPLPIITPPHTPSAQNSTTTPTPQSTPTSPQPNPPPNTTNNHPMQTRGKDGVIKPKPRYLFAASTNITTVRIPRTTLL
ncbi:hypothetical protein OSB04_022593 [Centaurea solstitialis]|uniref:Integrase catalytic domain-containing protein n=1 Tax=Centaurea solstitialis TaxID=347529 RepID=A0AA38SWG4_9ASTR|nr:hypothetical protein OSB04_022593 [Centaurea solstitialis]